MLNGSPFLDCSALLEQGDDVLNVSILREGVFVFVEKIVDPLAGLEGKSILLAGSYITVAVEDCELITGWNFFVLQHELLEKLAALKKLCIALHTEHCCCFLPP